jgi:hypothetical protein
MSLNRTELLEWFVEKRLFKSNDSFSRLKVAEAVFPGFTCEWHQKTGSRKGNQYWVYCESSQFNYIKWSFNAGGLLWSSDSRVMRYKHSKQSSMDGLIFIENIRTFPARGVLVEPCALIGYIEYFNLNDLEEVPETWFEFVLDLQPDKTVPIHPDQVNTRAVNLKFSVTPSAVDYPAPYSYFSSVQFSKRMPGWFRLKGTLLFKNQVFQECLSETFMLNNPRMRKHPELLSYSPAHVKFMQLSSILCEDEIQQAAKDLGYSNEMTKQLLEDSCRFFPQCTKRSNNPFRNIEEPTRKKSRLSCKVENS